MFVLIELDQQQRLISLKLLLLHIEAPTVFKLYFNTRNFFPDKCSYYLGDLICIDLPNNFELLP
jgi:hypothetical protein